MHCTAACEYLTGEGASRKVKVGVTYQGTMKAFEALKWVCMTVPILMFADYTKPFLLEIGGCVVAEASGRLVPPCGLWHQVPNST